MFRRYIITIEVNNAAVEHLRDIEKVFGCSISEPSNWVEYGSTKEKGLTFLDKNGHELASPVFIHQPYFPPTKNNAEAEADEIKQFVLDALARHYPITLADVKIKVVEYNRV